MRRNGDFIVNLLLIAILQLYEYNFSDAVTKLNHTLQSCEEPIR